MSGDLVMDALEHLKSMLGKTKPRGALLNGNIEVFLKTCFASHFDSKATADFSYVMDKYFEGEQIDFLLLKDRTPILAIEFKCTLASAVSSGRGAARRAIIQAENNVPLLARYGVRKIPSFIVHFLCAHYPKGLLPDFIWGKFPKGQPQSGRVLEVYLKAADENLLITPRLIDLVKDYGPMPDVHLEVIVTQVKPRTRIKADVSA